MPDHDHDHDRERTTGPPTSTNGASSLHVWWQPIDDRPTTVEAILEIVDAPTVDKLHFWALQATFADRRNRSLGTAHLGLQWHPAHPGGTAVNWGGYRSDGRGELAGTTPSVLPSATGNPNTRDYPWRPRRLYRLTIGVDGTGSVMDHSTGRTTVVRRLAVDRSAAYLTNPVVWSEVFADCDDPPTTVRWSHLRPAPTALHATYQSYGDGGCTNTDVELDGERAILQRTNTRRTTPEGRLA